MFVHERGESFRKIANFGGMIEVHNRTWYQRGHYSRGVVGGRGFRLLKSPGVNRPPMIRRCSRTGPGVNTYHAYMHVNTLSRLSLLSNPSPLESNGPAIPGTSHDFCRTPELSLSGSPPNVFTTANNAVKTLSPPIEPV